jgi:UDP-N-acetylglucosamine--N-acetylmuramyl-(pentapeptide) pyrophosphoryl-undecaprenol N-acetylglucosamine transferase
VLAAGPAYLAARPPTGLPIIIHEANARPQHRQPADHARVHRVGGVRLPHTTAIGIPLRAAITELDRPALRNTADAGSAYASTAQC